MSYPSPSGLASQPDALPISALNLADGNSTDTAEAPIPSVASVVAKALEKQAATPVPAMPGGSDALHLAKPKVEPGTASTEKLTDRQIRMILDISRLMAVPTDVDSLLCKLAEITTGLLDCERASIFLFDDVRSELWTKVALGSKEIRVPCHAGIVGHAFKTNEVVHVPDPYADPRFNPEPDKRSGFRTRNLLSAPMAGLDGKPQGVIQAVNKKGTAFSENDLALVQLLAEQAGVAIQRHRLQQTAMEVAALRREMDLAHETQQALIPRNPPEIPGVESAGWTLPASITGGDCFDLWQLPDGRLGVLVADASGHGLAPALVVSQARTLVRALSEIETDPHKILVRVNARLNEDLDWGQFVTAFLAFLDPDGTLHWSSAGHGPVMIRTSPGEPLRTLDPPVQPLGVLDQWMDGAPESVKLEQGGSLILVSDGIFEATNAAGEQLGVDRMCHTIDTHRGAAPAAVLTALKEEVERWYAGMDPLDDQTIVIVRRSFASVD